MGEFAGWEMPISYPLGTLEEHKACRNGVAVFDVSHLGTVRVRGAGAFAVLQRTFTNDLGKIRPGKAQYTHLLDRADGSVQDDVIVWWVEDDWFDVMPNASNTQGVLGALSEEARSVGVSLDVADVTDQRAVIAVQGPAVDEVLGRVLENLGSRERFGVVRCRWEAEEVIVAGTGYTGEEGVELAVPVTAACSLWSRLLANGSVPAGLAARDTLRLEMGFPLHGHELGPGITPLQAGLGWVVAWSKGDFRGRAALEEEMRKGPTRRLVGLLGRSRRPLRDGCAVLYGSRRVGVSTSGSFSPCLERGIGLALVEADVPDGAEVEVDVRGRAEGATIVRPPFVRPGAGCPPGSSGSGAAGP
ncbi:MAG: aminomethyltransferase [Acidimicrobiales bacterium]|nr:MAG: aminomethyltransferase [Acidimicrobiales bacterium]